MKFKSRIHLSTNYKQQTSSGNAHSTCKSLRQSMENNRKVISNKNWFHIHKEMTLGSLMLGSSCWVCRNPHQKAVDYIFTVYKHSRKLHMNGGWIMFQKKKPRQNSRSCTPFPENPMTIVFKIQWHRNSFLCLPRHSDCFCSGQLPSFPSS